MSADDTGTSARLAQDRVDPTVTLAFSVRQPWAELIVSGRKTIELRAWPTSYRGLLWVHTGRSVDQAALSAFFGPPTGYTDDRPATHTLFRGGYVGAVKLMGCVPLTPERWRVWADEHLSGTSYRRDFWGWLLSDPVRFEQPLPARGRLKLFQPESEDAVKLAQMYRERTSRQDSSTDDPPSSL